MKLEPDYYGAVKVVAGEHAGKLAYLDDYDVEDGKEVAIVYLEGQEPTVGVYVLLPLEQLDQPDTEADQAKLEKAFWATVHDGEDDTPAM